MQSKILSRRTLLIVILVGCVFFLALLFRFIHKSPNQISLESLDKQEKKMNSGLPMRLNIPKINVDAVVEHVGLTSDGAMDVPKNPDDVAWFDLGIIPGAGGSAVMAGHYGRWKSGKGSVFDDLNKLSSGDKLYVENDKGVITTFVVRESRTYDPNADASDVFSSNDGKAHLNLITCEGSWNKASQIYSERLVVFTDKE